MAKSKRTIKLRQANLQGNEYIKVDSNNTDSYPDFDHFMRFLDDQLLQQGIGYNPNWFLENLDWLDRNNAPGVGSATDWIDILESIEYPTFIEFMFENTIFDPETYNQNPSAFIGFSIDHPNTSPYSP